MKKTRTRTSLAALLALPLLAGAAGADGKAEQTVEDLERHWQMTMSEPDAAKQQALLKQHEKMMEQARGMMTHRDMHAESEQRDLENTIELHRSMMDMMR